LVYHNEEAKDDNDDFIAYIFHNCQAAMAEGRKFNFPPTMTGEEIERLGVLVSQVDRPVQPPLPRYATNIVPPGLTKEEALQQALRNSAPLPPLPPPPSFNPWAPPLPPPPSAAPAYVPPVANWRGRYRTSSCLTTTTRSRLGLLVFIFYIFLLSLCKLCLMLK
jgi:hypothetical protein